MNILPKNEPHGALLHTKIGRVEVHVSSSVDDQRWDDFLRNAKAGQFQQSSAWARYKQTQSWSVIRAVLVCENVIIGGFQMLWKYTRRGKVAYVSKGPVLESEDNELSTFVVTLLRRVVVEQRFRAVIVQPPDDSSESLLEALKTSEFLSAPFLGVIDSTLVIDLIGGETDVVGRFRKSTRNKYNKAVRNALTIHEGDERDIPEFFSLMAATCERQGVAPNPPNQEALEALWSSMNGQNMAHLKFAAHQGELFSGDLFICFGNRISIFKTGWAGLRRDLQPNNFVICEALKWACANQFEVADFVGLERGLADTLIQGDKISEFQNQSRDAFKLGFGGQARILPSASLLIPNPVLRRCFRLAVSFPPVRRRLSRIF